MIGRDRILTTLSAALAGAAGDEAELVAVAGRNEVSRCANSVIHQNVCVEDALLVARVIVDGRAGRASAHGLSPETASRVLADAAALARFAPPDPAFGGLPGPRAIPEARSHVERTARVGPEERAKALKSVFDAARRHDLQVAGAYRTAEKELAVANTRGVAAYAPLTSASTNLVALGENASGYADGAEPRRRRPRLRAAGGDRHPQVPGRRPPPRARTGNLRGHPGAARPWPSSWSG